MQLLVLLLPYLIHHLQLSKGSPEEKEMVLMELMPSALQLMTDAHGSSVINAIFERASSKDKLV